MMSGIESSARIVPMLYGEVYDAEDVDDFLDSMADTIKVLGKEVLKARKEWQ